MLVHSAKQKNERTRRYKIVAICLIFSLISMILWGGEAPAEPAPAQPAPAPTPATLQQGKQLYAQECQTCHGVNGDGNGEAAYLLFPKPRDFTGARYKIQSTPSGSLPTDADLFTTITRGMPGSAMPSFTRLTESERWALVHYIKTFSDKFQTQTPRPSVVPGQEPPMTPETVAKGKVVYALLRCTSCHGVAGAGDGFSASTLKDASGFPILPNNFTRGVYKGGGTNADIYMRFTTGMAGTPMPSYEMVVNEAERWALVHYVKSLAGSKVAVSPSTGLITAKKITGEVPKNPMAESWAEMTPSNIPLMLLWQRQEAAESVSVRAVHNDKEIAFLLEWEDLSPQGRFIRHQDFTDGAALQFAISPVPAGGTEGGVEKLPQFPMGSKNEPVNLWYWRADRQMDLARYVDLEDVYPGMIGEDYQSTKDYYSLETHTRLDVPSREVISAPGQEKTFMTAWGVENPMANPWRTTAIEDLNAVGFGTLTAQSPEGQNISGVGFWVEGKWRVVFVRQLNSADAFDAKFQPGAKVPIAFAVWDGSKGDRDGQKAVTTWYTLQIEK